MNGINELCKWFYYNTPGGSLPSEDRVNAKLIEGRLYTWVIDGASSIDPKMVMSTGQTGGEWHADQIDLALTCHISCNKTLEEILSRAIRHVSEKFYSENAMLKWPKWAYPLSAISFIQLSMSEDGTIEGSGLHLADCPVLAIGKEAKTIYEYSLHEETRTKSGSQQHISEAVDILKHRRVKQHDNPHPNVAGLNESCVKQAVKTKFTLERSEALMLMTDGLTRIWEEYHLETKETALNRLRSSNTVMSLIDEMRAFETNAYKSFSNRMLKSSDDASIVCINID